MSKLRVSEVFGPTVQGEGPAAGQRCGFLRLGGCNLTCRWCDTAYTWDWTGVSDVARERGRPFDPKAETYFSEPGEIAGWLVTLDVPLLVVSGGEPLLQQQPLTATLLRYRLRSRAKHRPVRVEVETNGTRPPDLRLVEQVNRFVVSPKLDHSRAGPREVRVVPDVLNRFAELHAEGAADVAFKFVVQTAADLDEVAGIVAEVERGGVPVWVMPEGRTVEAVTGVLAAVADGVVAAGWNLSGRLHLQAWGDVRGH